VKMPKAELRLQVRWK